MRRGRTQSLGTVAAHPCGGGFLLWLIGIAVAALLLRLGVSMELSAIAEGRNSVFTPSRYTDLATYMQLARDMAAGRYQGEFYYQPFYYAVFLPGCYLLSGGSVWFVVVVQSFLGAATCYLAGLSAARLFGRIAGLATAALTALSTALLLYTPYHQNETLQTFNLTLLFYLTLRACERWTLPRWSVVGALTGIAILTRGNIWLFVPGLIALLLLSGHTKKQSRRRLWGGVGLFLLLLLAVQLPFAVHNTRLRGTLTGPSTAANAVLALGNSPEAPAGGRNPGLPAGPMEYPEAYHEMMAKAEQGVSVGRQMWEWMREEPKAFFELQFRKLLLFWDSREIPNNVSLYGEGEHSKLLRLLLPGRSLVIIALGVAGMLFFVRRMFRRKSLRLALLYHFVLAYLAAVAVFYILSRFRAPALPFLAIFGGGFLATLLRSFRLKPEPRRQRLLLGGVALLAGFWLSGFSYDLYRTWEPAIQRFVRPDGTFAAGAHFDYGPFTFGGWSEEPAAPGLVLQKTFAVGDEERGTLKLQVISGSAGSITLRVNGELIARPLPPPGLGMLELPVTLHQGRVSIEVVRMTGALSFLYDLQRDYGRSLIQGEKLPGEWIFRFLPEKRLQK